MHIPRPIAEELLPIVNDVEDVKALDAFFNMRIEQLHKELETATNIDTVRQIQGAIQELRKLKLLPEYVKSMK